MLSCPSLGMEEACVCTGLESRLKAFDVILPDNVLIPISTTENSCNYGLIDYVVTISGYHRDGNTK